MVFAMSNRKKTSKYGFSSAVLFFLVGLGIGASSAFIYDPMPQSKAALARFKQWRTDYKQNQPTKKRAA
jgi:hypothetical protein